MLSGIKRGKKKATGTTVTPGGETAVAATPTPTRSMGDANVRAAAELQAAFARRGAPDDDDDHAVLSSSSYVSLSPHVPLQHPTTHKGEQDMSMTELVAQERNSNNHDDVDEEVRAIMRTNKRRKVKMSRTASLTNRSDEEDAIVERHTAALASNVPNNNNNKKDNDDYKNKVQKRWQARQLALHDKQNALATASWWWIESARFDPTSLVSFAPSTGNATVTLAPVSQSWHSLECVRYPHFYITPNPYTKSGAACDENVWNDIVKYQQSLRSWVTTSYRDKQIIFAEVVLPSNNSSTQNATAFHQARIHGMVVPKHLYRDAPLIFQSALQELVLDHGTHQKKIHKIDDSTKSLPQMIPSHFSYIYVDYGGDADHRGGYRPSEKRSGGTAATSARKGCVLILEERHRDVTNHWAADVLAGRLGLDPMRMRNKSNKTKDNNMTARVQALKDWDKFDWTQHR